jgi:hypothetical protein
MCPEVVAPEDQLNDFFFKIQDRSALMPPLSAGPGGDPEIVIATIGNQKNPAQVVEIIHQPDIGVFVTRGIDAHFRIKDIAVPQQLMLSDIQEITGVLSFVLERIATAADLDLPFRYDPEFEVGEGRYVLQESNEYMILARRE